MTHDDARPALHRLDLARHPDDGWQSADPYPMGRRVRRSLDAIVRAVCPPAPAPATPELLERVQLYVLSFMRYMHPLSARGLWLAILFLDWSPRFLFESRHRLHRLDRERAAGVLTRLQHSRLALLRTLLVAVRGLILSGYFDQDEVHQALDYSPIPFIRERQELRLRLLHPAPAP